MYVRINLLPQELRPKKALIAVDFRVAFAGAVIIAAVVLGGYYYSLDRDIRQLQTELNTWKQQQELLQDAVDLQNEVSGLRDEVSKRISVVHNLTGESDIRFDVLQYLNDSTPDNLWLMRIAERENGGVISFTIEGMSYEKESISAFLARLQRCNHLQRVALESIRPAPLEIRDAYQYSVIVDLRSGASGDALADAGTGSGAK